ncbi:MULTISPECIES: cation:proton antiporter [unclassified Lentilitoribacter]|jgi:multicomponent Na+:H+ antiporter subunit F|uniref:cation:proton antiporter n=1 Tax=unclassified Lentilitoribacter TaxID=2647570 RepID=UPI0013A6DFEE|nr:cation:proton antiporter [Lentilitoribacter sp. Alg239-R112]
MTAQAVLDLSITIALVLLSGSFLLTVYRIIKGPTLPDRVLGLDMLVAVAIGYIAVIGIKTGYTLYVDIAIALGLVGFLATIAFARFIMVRGQADEEGMGDSHEIADEGTTKAIEVEKQS